MKLDTEFIRLPFRFDAARLAEEIAQIPESDWRPHPQGNPGNSALPLIALRGNPLDDGVKGPMRPTIVLEKMPYLRQVIASFGVPVGRTRLMRLIGNAEATAHADVNYYWMRRTRIHIPVITTPDVSFHCGERSLNMAAGECWLFDTWRVHNVFNPAPTMRIHLVVDTVGAPTFWDVVARSERPFGKPAANPVPMREVAFEPGAEPPLILEDRNFPVVMSPDEMRDLVGQCLQEMDEVAANPRDQAESVRAFMQQWMADWAALWAQHQDRPEAWEAYRALVKKFDAWRADAPEVRVPNNNFVRDFLMHIVTNAALNPDLAEEYGKGDATPRAQVADVPSRFDRPVFIVSAPRSGSSLLFETLARSPDFWTVGGESHLIFEKIPKFQPENNKWESNRLTAQDAVKPAVMRLRDAFVSHLRGRDGKFLPASNAAFRLLEKTPKNALRVPLLAAAFPDALFIYLYRNPRDNLSSMLDAWRSHRFVTYPQLPDWSGDKWSLLLVPGWRSYIGQPLADTVAYQWETTQKHLLDDLEELPPERWCTVRYEDFLKSPQATIERLCAFCDVRWDQELGDTLPNSQHTLTPPDPDKWKRNEAELTQMLPRVQATAERAEQVVAAHDLASKVTDEQRANVRLAPTAPVVAIGARAESPKEQKEQMFGSEFTSNLLGILKQLQISLVITTYQAGKMIVVRHQDEKLNTHFLLFQKPMGMAANQQRMAVGTAHAIEVYKNIPEVAKRKQPPTGHDACYIHQYTHITGDIDIHEMAWGKDNQLWFLNTKFSTLCTLDLDHSFVPKWRPRFVTALSPEDRCHLNGLAMVDGKPRYVTALGETDSNEGWRQNKASGGIMIDIATDKVVCRGLSMPHSPRLHDGKIWVLESGKGSLGIVDFASGRTITVAEVPGFTRGIDFYGNLAFIGLSQVRESIAFSGLPITERAQERNCGVWIVDIRNGQTIGFLRFKGAVQEIFSVQVLRNIRSPDILEQSDPLTHTSYVLPTEALRQVPKQLLKA